MTVGFLVMDKPAGITSHDVVAAVRAVTGLKVGHTGTLDPFATGVLALGLGAGTKLIQYLDESIKVYDATIVLGSATDTGDLTGAVIREADIPELTREKVNETLKTFMGDQMQEPPPYSAVKVNGKPLYYYARKGEVVRAEPRPINIHQLEILELTQATLKIRIGCSRGTYARVLADDIATALGTAGHLGALSRPRSGPFEMDRALDMQTLADWVSAEEGKTWQEVLLSRRSKGKKPRPGGDVIERKPTERVKWRPRSEVLAKVRERIMSPLQSMAHLPIVDVDIDGAKRVMAGAGMPDAPAGCVVGNRFVVAYQAELVAIAENTPGGVRSVKVVPLAARRESI